MSHEPIQRRAQSLAVMLLGLASLLVWMGSAANFAMVRTRTTRTLHADDSDLTHKHTATSTVTCSAPFGDSGGFVSSIGLDGIQTRLHVEDAGVVGRAIVQTTAKLSELESVDALHVYFEQGTAPRDEESEERIREREGPKFT